MALVPLDNWVSAEEVAHLAGVPEAQLSRIVRMTATASFLYEPQPGHIAHTSLSAAFVTNLSLFDATMFLADSAAPTAMSMSTATQRQSPMETVNGNSAYSIAFNTEKPFQAACSEQPRLHRRYVAYSRYTGATDDGFIELLSRLNWGSLGRACVVEVRHVSRQ